MKIAIHSSSWGFSRDWINYCERHNISFKIVDCYSTNIVDEVADCSIVMWHHHHTSAHDVLFAKQLLFSLEQSGKKVFPNFNTGWHFDDKLGQKYLLEAVDAPTPKSYVFFKKADALTWIHQASFPKVFKLRGGAGSTNVKLVKTKDEAISVTRKAFGKGFESYDRWGDFKESFRRYLIGKAKLMDMLKSSRRLLFSTKFARTIGRQKGYVLFQDFIGGNKFDIRVVTIGDRAFAIKRLVRENDFRASGSGFIEYESSLINPECLKIAFETSEKLNAQVVAYDFVFDNGKPLIVEINYGYAHESYFNCPGYWDRELNFFKGSFNSAEWMIEILLGQEKKDFLFSGR